MWVNSQKALSIDPDDITAPPTTSPSSRNGATVGTGSLVVNADDWGRDRETTDKTLDCVRRETVSAVSAMMFMEDSERAAALSQEHDVDSGLHLNFSSAFTASKYPPLLVEHHRNLARFLLSHPMARLVYHPGLRSSFEYVLNAQIEEFHRLYGRSPARLDGHHHLHLSTNVLVGNLLPPGTLIRRNFSFQAGEKGRLNRFYREMVDRKLARQHRMVDFVFNLAPVKPLSRLDRIFSMAQDSVVELETHPINVDEYRFLMEGEVFQGQNSLRIAKGFPAGGKRFVC